MITLLGAALLLAVSATFSGCAAHNPQDDPDSFEAVKDIHGGPFTDMMLVYLKTGPNSASQTKEENAEHFKGHMANMKRLADAGVLLIGGPFNAPRDKAWRGIFVLDTSSVQLAKLQAETDPAIKAGVFTAEYQPIKATIALRHSGDLEKAMLARAKDAPPPDPTKPPPSIRAYVMVTADDAASAKAALDRSGLSDKIVWCAAFSGVGDRGAVVVLDAQSVDGVKAALEKSGAGTKGLGLDGWWSTASLTGFEPAARKLP